MCPPSRKTLSSCTTALWAFSIFIPLTSPSSRAFTQIHASQRIDAIRSVLEQGLSQRLAHALRSGSLDITAQCIRTYAVIDKMPEAVTLFRQLVVEPMAAKVCVFRR